MSIMKKQGKVLRWDAARGFGFIRSPDAGADIFFHIKEYRGSGLPKEGERVSFDEIHMGGKGPRAMGVTGISDDAPVAARQQRSAANRAKPWQAATPQRIQPHSSGSAAFIWLLILGWIATLVWGVGTHRFPFWVLGAALILNLLTFYIYWVDKHAAQNRRWRTREQTLHLWGLLGGWPGAWLAQGALRHKSSKAEFQAAFWGTVMLHCAALLGWIFWL